MSIKLETLSLISFDKNNPEHILFFKKILSDESIKKRFSGFLPRLNSNSSDIINKAFFVSDNNKLIGFIDIGAFNQEEKAIYLRGAIDKNERGFNYGHKMLDEISNYIFINHPMIEKIKLKIAYDNIASIKTAESCGFYSILNNYYEKNNPFKHKTK